MQSLLLINFERDADSIYVGFEPQSFGDEIHGQGMLVIGWRQDGRVDVFHEPGLRLKPESYAIAGRGLHVMAPRSFGEAVFTLGADGAQLDVEFHDLDGRRVQLVIRETDERARNPFGLLAPMGSDTAEPPALPLVYVDGFYFVRRARTEVRIEIDGRVHRGDSIPLILDGARVHFLRYSMDPFIAFWNPDWDAAARILEPLAGSTQGRMTAFADGVHHDLVANGPFTEIERMLRREGSQTVRVEFSPPLPAPRMARLLFRVVSMFREWPATYVWRGRLEHPVPAAPAETALVFESGWQRVAPRLSLMQRFVEENLHRASATRVSKVVIGSSSTAPRVGVLPCRESRPTAWRGEL